MIFEYTKDIKTTCFEVKEIEMFDSMLFINSYLIDSAGDKNSKVIIHRVYLKLREAWIKGEKFIRYHDLRERIANQILLEEQELKEMLDEEERLMKEEENSK